MEQISAKISDIVFLCKRYNVAQLFLFGSFAKGDFKKDSDIDLLVYFNNVPLLDYADNFFDFMYSLEDLLGRKIDLVSGKAMKNPYFIQEVEQTKRLLYDYSNQKIAV